MNVTGKVAAKFKHYNIFTVYPAQYLPDKIYATMNMLINP